MRGLQSKYEPLHGQASACEQPSQGFCAWGGAEVLRSLRYYTASAKPRASHHQTPRFNIKQMLLTFLFYNIHHSICGPETKFHVKKNELVQINADFLNIDMLLGFFVCCFPSKT